MRTRKEFVPTLFAALATLLPGDVIHDVAPISVKSDARHGLDAINAARDKRERKAAKRKGAQ